MLDILIKLTILNYVNNYRFVVMSTTTIIIHVSIRKINDKILVITNIAH